MNPRLDKTSTDEFWNRRAVDLKDHERVNIHDLPQRQCENSFIFRNLNPADEILEVGCGNGFLTQDLRKAVKHVDAFDFSDNMIVQAKEIYGEENNSFFTGSVLDENVVTRQYDAVVCVRVLINLANLDEQKTSINNMVKWLKPGGRLILVEGYLDGFETLNDLRNTCGLEKMKPASINYYCHLADLRPFIDAKIDVDGEWDSGVFDLMTRVVYPLLVGADKATGPSEFHEKILPLALGLEESSLARFGRLQGVTGTRRS